MRVVRARQPGASNRQASVRLGCASDRLPGRATHSRLARSGCGAWRSSLSYPESPLSRIYSCPNRAGRPSLTFNRVSFFLRLRLLLFGIARDAPTVVKRVFGDPVADRTARHVIRHGYLLPLWMVSCMVQIPTADILVNRRTNLPLPEPASARPSLTRSAGVLRTQISSWSALKQVPHVRRSTGSSSCQSHINLPLPGRTWRRCTGAPDRRRPADAGSRPVPPATDPIPGLPVLY